MEASSIGQRSQYDFFFYIVASQIITWNVPTPNKNPYINLNNLLNVCDLMVLVTCFSSLLCIGVVCEIPLINCILLFFFFLQTGDLSTQVSLEFHQKNGKSCVWTPQSIHILLNKAYSSDKCYHQNLNRAPNTLHMKQPLKEWARAHCNASHCRSHTFQGQMCLAGWHTRCWSWSPRFPSRGSGTKICNPRAL